jgi:predicted dehydrogenase
MLRWGLIGCGDIAAKRVAAALQQARDSRLVAVSRRRAELAAGFAAAHGADRGFADWRDLARDDGINAVYVATPVHLHAEQTIAAVEAGKHVLCEKPMAIDVASCERMIAAARAANVRLGVAYYRHFYPIVARLRELVANGTLGRIALATAEAFERFDAAEGQPRAWLLRASESGGGPMFDFGCHRVEVLLDVLGPAVEARAACANVVYCERQVEDTCAAVIRFECGALASVLTTHAAVEPRDALHVYGTEGSVHVPVLNAGIMRVVTPAGEHEEVHPTPPNLHLPLVEDFVDAVRDQRTPTVSGETGLAVARVMAAIYVR